MNARLGVGFALSVVVFGAMLGGCATTVSNPWWYYHYDPSSGSTTMSNPWWYYHYDPYGYDYRYYGYPWPNYYYRYDPYYPYWRYDARPMVSPSPPAVFDHRASTPERERDAAGVRPYAHAIAANGSKLSNDRTLALFARALDANGFAGLEGMPIDARQSNALHAGASSGHVQPRSRSIHGNAP